MPNKKEAKKKSSGKETMVEKATNTAPPGPQSPDRFENRAAVIELLEEKARQSANSPSDQEEEVYPILINFLRSLTDKQWRVIRKGMRDPTTRMQLGRLCRRVVKVICETAFRVFLPALVQILEQSDSEEEEALAPGPDPERSSSTNSQDQEAVPTLVSSSPSSMTSLQRAPVRDPLKVYFGVTADTIIEALGDDRSSSPELTRALVGETLSQLNSAFSVVVAYTPSGSSSPVMTERKNAMPATKEMVRVISGTLQAFGVTGQGLSGKVSMEVREKILAPMTGEVMTALVETMEGCRETLGGGQDAAADMLREVALKIKMLSQSDDRDGSYQEGSHSSEETRVTPGDSGASEAMVSQNDLAIIGSREFHTKASRAVSGILQRSGSSHSCSVQSSQPASAAPSLTYVHGSHVTSTSATNTFDADCDAEANKIIDAFVADVKDITAHAEEAGDSTVQAGGTNHDAASFINQPSGRPSRKQRVFSAMLRLYSNLQSNVAEFFNMGSATTGADLMTSSPLEEPRQEVNSEDVETLSLSESSQSMRAGSDSQTRLVESTTEVIGGILTTFKLMAEEESEASIGRRSSEESLAAGVFVGDVLSQLRVFTPSNSPSPSEEMLASLQFSYKPSPELSAKPSSTSTKHNETSITSIPAIDRLCSEGFKTKATKSVSEVLLRSPRDVSARLFTNRSEPSIRLPSQTSLSPLVVQHEASEIIETFVSNVRSISRSVRSGKKTRSLPAVICLIKKLQDKVRGFYARVMAQDQVPLQEEEPLASDEVKTASVLNVNAKSSQFSMSQPLLSGVVSGVMRGQSLEAELRRGHSKPLRESSQVSQEFLDNQTKEVVRRLVVLVRSDETVQVEGSSSVSMTWSNESLVISQFVESIIGWLEEISSSESTSLEGVNVTPNEVIRELMADRFKRRGTHAVRKVLIKSSRCFDSESLTSGVSRSHLDLLLGSSTTSTASTDAAAVDIFGTIVDGVKGLFQRGGSSNTVGPTDSVLLLDSFRDPEATESGFRVSEMDIWSMALRLYKSLQHKLSDFLYKKPETQVATLAEAKKSVSQILGVVQDEISKSDLLNRTGELSGLYSFVGTMLENVEKVYCEDGEPRTTSSMSTSSTKTLKSERTVEDMSFTLPGTPSPSDLQKVKSCPIVRSSMIGMSDEDDDDHHDHDQNDTVLESSLAGARNTMVAVVDTLFNPAELQQATSPSSAPLGRLEELLSQGKVQALSRDLVNQLKSLMFEQRNISLHHVGAGRSLSDSVLLKYTQRGRVTRGLCPSELMYAFAEESVKRLLVPLLIPPTSWGLDQKASSSSVSSSRRTSMDSKSSSQSYNRTVNLFTRALVHQVMDTVSLESELPEEPGRVTPLGEMIDGCQSVRCSPCPTLFGTGGCQSSVKANSSLASGSVRMCASLAGSEGEAVKTQAEPKGKRGCGFLRFLPKISQLKASFKRSKKSNRKESQAPEAAQEQDVEHCISTLFRRMVSGLCNPFKKTPKKTQKPI